MTDQARPDDDYPEIIWRVTANVAWLPLQTLRELCDMEARQQRRGVWHRYVPVDEVDEGDWALALLLRWYRDAVDRVSAAAPLAVAEVNAWPRDRVAQLDALDEMGLLTVQLPESSPSGEVHAIRAHEVLRFAGGQIENIDSMLQRYLDRGAPGTWPPPLEDRPAFDGTEFDSWLDDVERLLANHPDAAWSPPAPEEAVQEAEDFLGVPFPPSYRAFLLRFNGACVGSFCIPGVGLGKEPPFDGGDIRFYPAYWHVHSVDHPQAILPIWEGGHEDPERYVFNVNRRQGDEYGVDVWGSSLEPFTDSFKEFFDWGCDSNFERF
jgi:hypothetical protein